MLPVTHYLDPATVEQLNGLRATARRSAAGSLAGGHRGPLRGASVEFRQHRPYTPGDDPRHLDWRVLARTDRPVVREFDEETNLRCLLVIDAGGSMAYRDKRDHAARLAAAVAYLLLSAGESVGVGVAAAGGLRHWVAPAAGSPHLSGVLGALDRAAPDPAPTDWPAAARGVVDRLGRRAVVVLVTDALAPVADLRDALARLRHGRHAVTVLRVLHDDEQSFPFTTWTRLRGLSGDGSHVCDPATARAAYLANFAAHRRDLRAACVAAAADLHEFTTEDAVVPAVSRMLSRRA